MGIEATYAGLKNHLNLGKFLVGFFTSRHWVPLGAFNCRPFSEAAKGPLPDLGTVIAYRKGETIEPFSSRRQLFSVPMTPPPPTLTPYPLPPSPIGSDLFQIGSLYRPSLSAHQDLRWFAADRDFIWWQQQQPAMQHSIQFLLAVDVYSTVYSSCSCIVAQYIYTVYSHNCCGGSGQHPRPLANRIRLDEKPKKKFKTIFLLLLQLFLYFFYHGL